MTTDEMVSNFDYYDNYARSGNGSGIFVGGKEVYHISRFCIFAWIKWNN